MSGTCACCLLDGYLMATCASLHTRLHSLSLVCVWVYFFGVTLSMRENFETTCHNS